MNGQTRLLAVVDKRGKIVARSIVRLLWDGEKPALFLERHYGDNRYKDSVLELAKMKARQMGLPLTIKEKIPGSSPYGKPLHSLGGIAPFEYCDGDMGVKQDSLFQISDVQVVPTS